MYINKQITRIDVSYLTFLSYEVVPEMTRLLDVSDEKVQNETIRKLKIRNDMLNARRENWYEFNYSRFKAKNVLAGYSVLK